MRRSRCGPLLPYPLRLTHALLVFTYPSRALQVPPPPPPPPLSPPPPPPPPPIHPQVCMEEAGLRGSLHAATLLQLARGSPSAPQIDSNSAVGPATAALVRCAVISPASPLAASPSALQLPCISFCICPCICPRICPRICPASPMHLPCVAPCICPASPRHLRHSLCIAHAPVRHLVFAAPHTLCIKYEDQVLLWVY